MLSRSVVRESSRSRSVVRESSRSRSVVRESSLSRSAVRESSLSRSVVRESSRSRSVVRESSRSRSVVRESSLSRSVVRESSLSRSAVLSDSAVPGAGAVTRFDSGFTFFTSHSDDHVRMQSLQRRDILALLATGTVAGLAGCSSSCPDADDPDPEVSVRRPTSPAGFDSPPAGDWPAPRYDPGYTGYTPEGAIPTDSVAVRWQARPPTAPVNEVFYEASSPVVADDRVLVSTGAGVTALDLRDGTQVWTTDPVSPATVPPTHGYDEEIVPPVVGGDTVFLAGRTELVALALADGTERWRSETTSPGIPAISERSVVVTSDAGTVSLDPETGEERWRVAAGSTVSVPAVGEGTVVCSGGPDNETVALDAATGDVQWRTDTIADSYPVVADGSVYLGTYEGLFAHAVGDGSRQWHLDRGSGRSLSAPVLTPDTLYLAERPGEAGDAAFAFDRTEGKPTPRWCSSVGDATVPAGTDDHALVLEGSPGGPDETRPSLVAFTAGFGDALWELGGRSRVLPPAVLDGAVVLTDREGRVLALGGGPDG
jgi:outer membrane protein assembly factor BamB/ribosomal protein S14